MEEISNKTLATLLIAAMIISLSGTIIALNRLGQHIPVYLPTGRAPSDTGTTSITVQQSVSIILQSPPGDAVDFGTGRVNASKVGCGQRANMIAADTYTDVGDCWIEEIGGSPVGWILENDGNLNASVSVRGPSESGFFRGYLGSYPRLLRWRVNVSDTGCRVDRNESWSEFAWNSTACNNMPWDGSREKDTFRVHVNISVPSDLTSGTYSNSSIEFYAVASTWS